MTFRVILFLLFAVPWSTHAQALTPYSTGSCEPAQAETLLETGNVRARIFNHGGLFWNRGLNKYEVPKGSGINGIFNANLILGGFVNDELRMAGTSYGPYEFWPGPISQPGVSPADCSIFDRFWHLDHSSDFRAEDQLIAPSAQLLDWPTDLGAPFLEKNGEPGYQPDAGDLPFMNGDSQIWWVMNDLGNSHERTKTPPLSVEVRASAFGFKTTNELGNVTFYRYQIVNRGTETIHDMVVGMHQDIDLGNFADDLLGTDTTHAMLYAYTENNSDGSPNNPSHYGISPPALGFIILEASHQRGILPSDRGLPPSAHLTAARNIYGGGGATGDPVDGADFYSYMSGAWKDGVPMTEGGYGRDFSTHPMPFWMPGDPVTGSYWSEMNVNGKGTRGHGSDRKSLLSYGDFDLAPGEWARFTFVIAWARGIDHLHSVTRLRTLAAELHANREVLLAPRSLKAPIFMDGNPPETPQHPFWVDEPYPNPADNRVTLRMSLRWDAPMMISVHDMLSRERLRESSPASPGPLMRTLDVSGWPPGLYVIRVSQRGDHIDWPLIVL